MNVATKVEIATSGTAALTQGKLGAASTAGKAGTAQSFLSTKASAEKSFRADWQALLASLSSNVEESSKTAANQATASTEAEAGEAAGKSSGSSSTSSANSGLSLTDLRLSQGAEKGNEAASVVTKLSAANVRAEDSTAWTNAKTTKSISSKTEKTSTEQKTKSDSRSTSTSSADSAKTTDLAVTSAVDVVPAASASVSQAVSAPVIVTPVTSSTNEKASAMSSDLSTDLPTDFAATSVSPYPANIEGAFGVSENANAAGLATGKEIGKPQNESQASSDPSGVRPSDATLTTALPNAQEAASPSIGLSTENRSQLEVPASGLKQSQAAEPDQNSSQALVPGQDATPALASSQNQIQKPAQSDKKLSAQSANRTDAVLQPVTISTAAQFGQSTEVSPIVDKPGSASGAKLSTSNAVRAIRKTGSVDSVQMASTQGQSSSTVAAHKAVSTSSETAGTSAVSQAGSSSSETFAALDAGSSAGSPAWIHAGAQRAEAGFQDPTLGWVGIRANTSGGGVHAQLVTDSTDAAQALSSQLTGLSAYLAEHRTPVETLTLTASDGGSAGWGSDQSAGQGMQQNPGQQSGQETAQGANAESQISSYQSTTVMTETSSQLQTVFDGSAQVAMPGGIRISVMA
jgi:hypothetical protein